MRSFICMVIRMGGIFYIDSFLVSGLGLCVGCGVAGVDDWDIFLKGD